MAFIKRKKRSFFYKDDENPEEYDEYDEENEEEEEDDEEEVDEEETDLPRSATARRQTYAAAPKADTANTRLVYNNNGEPKSYIEIYTPESRDDATEIAAALMRGHSVTINLESVPREVAIRILDFLNGVVFACGGELVNIAKNTWMVTPQGVGIKKQGFLTETESNDAFYG